MPEMEGDVYHKIDGQKAWKKLTVVLRTSGLYIKKGKVREVKWKLNIFSWGSVEKIFSELTLPFQISLKLTQV